MDGNLTEAETQLLEANALPMPRLFFIGLLLGLCSFFLWQ